jgi:hypothetical protein
MSTIYKYHLPIRDVVELAAPELFRPLYVGEQLGRDLYLWALVNPDTSTVVHRILIYGTGRMVDTQHGDFNYIGTVQMYDGLVWHVVYGGRA